MTTWTAKTLSRIPGATEMLITPTSIAHQSSVHRLVCKTQNCVGFCEQGKLVRSHHFLAHIQRATASSTSLASIKQNGHNPQLYSTKDNSPQKPSVQSEVKHKNSLPTEENSDDAESLRKMDSISQRESEKMNVYSRKASKATETIKEKVADRVKDMKENILTIPNLLSTTRLALSPVLGYLVVHESYTIGVCLFTVAGITDLLDGFIARNFKNQQSVLGSIIDPLADKCLVTILTLSLTVSGLIPVPLTVLMVGRDIGLVGSVFYLRYQSLAAPRTFARFFDVTHATVQLKPTTISKLNTAVQLGLVGFTLAAPVFHYVDHPLLHALWYTTAATTVLSGLSYVFSKDVFKFLRK